MNGVIPALPNCALVRGSHRGAAENEPRCESKWSQLIGSPRRDRTIWATKVVRFQQPGGHVGWRGRRSRRSHGRSPGYFEVLGQGPSREPAVIQNDFTQARVRSPWPITRAFGHALDVPFVTCRIEGCGRRSREVGEHGASVDALAFSKAEHADPAVVVQ